MGPSNNKGTFVGYNETSKAFIIYVLGERHVEVNQDMTFQEEETFKQSKDIECDLYIEEDEAPISKDHGGDSLPL